MPAVKSNILRMYIFRFLISLHFIGGVLIPFFLDWGRISFFQIMLLQSWFVLWVLILETPTGAIADHFGRKPSLIIAAMLHAIGVLAYVGLQNFYVFMLGEFIWAFGLAMMSGADESMVYDSLKVMKKEKYSKKILGRFGSIEMLGIMVGAPIGSVIAATLGLRWTMLLMAVPFSLAFLVALTLREPIRRSAVKINYSETLTKGIRYFYSHKILKILAFDGIAIAVLAFLIIWTYQLVLRDLGISIAYFGVVTAIMMGLQAVIMSNFGLLEKIAGSKKNYLSLSALIPGIGFILLGFSRNIAFSVILIALIAGFGLSRYVLVSNYMNKYIKSKIRATVLSTASMVESLGLAIMYLVVGLLAEWSLNYTLIIIGVLCVIVAIVSRVEEGHLID